MSQWVTAPSGQSPDVTAAYNPSVTPVSESDVSSLDSVGTRYVFSTHICMEAKHSCI